MQTRLLKLIFTDGTVQTERLGKDDALSDFFINRGIDLTYPWTTVKQILFLGGSSLNWEDITADWIE